ncbi:bifunctional sulfate adenylyltransferase/adenylylsulfate kinase [Solidesulfovibrio sp.]|uniref:bifunctional sulfate adenylyltransferase/adenylylsulfate kinase n=1 Tax=Solidesulfovibrio sp. TaxID=2910990 RepID=UPI002B215B5A|nr:bifunctional sulfate adenylyltransferase/adenylylsulfate kinase [Solidesulfovibrio sp.]MEA4855233.1 bifunctional sulfate adenylyltransferase/adenylylsulfate kinase [Solidesulfovibrio sp.]
MDTCATPLLASPQRVAELKVESLSQASAQLGPRQLCELEMLLSGAFSPLAGYMGREDFESVLAGMRLADGRPWPMPVALDVPEALAKRLGPGDKLALRDQEGFMLAVLTVSEVWPSAPAREAAALYGLADIDRHPEARAYAGKAPFWHVGGAIEGVSLPLHADFPELRRTPAEVRAVFRQRGWRKVLGCQPRAFPHNRQRAVLRKAAAAIEGSILLVREAGDAISGGALHFAGVRCARLFAESFPPNMLLVNLLPLCSRQAGPRQALFEALVQKNHGCTHTLVGLDHADPLDADGAPLYAPGQAQRLVADFEAETGIVMVPETAMDYVEEKAQFVPRSAVAPGMTVRDLPPAELKRRLEFDLDIPEWFTPPAVAAELRAVYPPRSRQGLTLFMTGLSGAGKSTLARLLFVKFMELRTRPVTLLDGDIVRRHLSSELTFSKEHRNLNISRIGYVASEITKNGGIAICAPIAPYESSRAEARALVRPYGGFVEIHVSTPLAVCEQRDRKGLYAKARAGIVKGVTGIDDPYEVPAHPEISLDTAKLTPGEAVQEVLLYLEREGYLG